MLQENTLRDDIAGVLIMYAVYFSPADFPGRWVLRKWTIEDFSVRPDVRESGVADSLGELRRLKPPGMIVVSRHDEDDPVLWETWI